jgi:hypothetical protein
MATLGFFLLTVLLSNALAIASHRQSTLTMEGVLARKMASPVGHLYSHSISQQYGYRSYGRTQQLQAQQSLVENACTTLNTEVSNTINQVHFCDEGKVIAIYLLVSEVWFLQ